MTEVKKGNTSDRASVEVAESVQQNNLSDKNSTPREEFSWAKAEGYSKEEREKLSAQYDSTLKKITANEIVKAKIVAVGNKEVVLSIGFKSDGLVPIAEFKDLPGVHIGDELDVFVENLEDKNGQLVLSRKRAKMMRMWESINTALAEDKVVEGIVKRRTKGGLVVDLMGIEAFLPGSQIDVKPVRDYDAYVNKKMEFKVVKINHTQGNVVVSHKALIEKDIEVQKLEMLKNIQKGQVLEGTVKNITDFGVFVDLGGLDGLVHITDLTWGRVNHPSEIVSLDQKINVVIIDYDETKKRISLGMKQLLPHPWDALPEDIQAGSKVKGKIATLFDYGAFIEIMPGVEGLIHVSEMSWSLHPKNPAEMFKTGQEVQAVILTMDKQERKMSLSLKRLTADPWETVPEKYAPGTKHKGIVRNLTNYGVFVELEDGVGGMVHISDLSWTKKFKHPSDYIKKDEKMEVVVLSIDKDNRRLSLGHKQLTQNPWDVFEKEFSVGSAQRGVITKLGAKGSIVELPYALEGFIPKKYMPKDVQLQVGDTMDLAVIEFEKDAQRIVLASPKSEAYHTRMGETKTETTEAVAVETETEIKEESAESKETAKNLPVRQAGKKVEKSDKKTKAKADKEQDKKEVKKKNTKGKAKK